MAELKTDGNCYICGKTFGKTAMKNHILKEHATNGDEECLLLKVEGAYAKEYWLFVDIAKDKTLSSLDAFMRKIWLECCGHMSTFHAGYANVGKTRKLSMFSVGDKIIHEYDMGTTTECLITVVGDTLRSKQKNAVRLFARNNPLVCECASCGKPAELICQECMYDSGNPNYCSDCAKGHEHEYLVPITNSPRNGECGYDGEFDTFTFDSEKL